MALASEDEWESDPELKAMRRDFVASFVARRIALQAALPALRAGGEGFGQALGDVLKVAHKLAGAAETYGFPTLTRVSSAFEDWVDRRERGHAPEIAVAATELLIRLLDACQLAGKDAPEHAVDPALAALEGGS